MDTNEHMMAVITAMQSDSRSFAWSFRCRDDLQFHINRAIMYDGQFLTWHNCDGTSCCGCHSAQGPTAYFGSELQDNENLDLFWQYGREAGVL